MAVESLYLASSVSGQASNPSNAIGNTPSTWAGDVNSNTSWTHTWNLSNPVASSTADPGTQTFTLRTRKGSNSGNPTISFQVRRGGTTLASSATTTVTSTTGQDVVATWDTTGGEDLTGLSIYVVQTSAGGSPSARNMAQVAMVTWNALVFAPVTLRATGSPTTVVANLLPGNPAAIRRAQGTPTAVVSALLPASPTIYVPPPPVSAYPGVAIPSQTWPSYGVGGPPPVTDGLRVEVGGVWRMVPAKVNLGSGWVVVPIKPSPT